MQRSFNHNATQSIFRQLQTIKPIAISHQSRTMTTEAQAAKKALRKEIKSRLSSLSENEIATQSEQAQKVILNLDQYKQAKSLSIYLSMPAAEAQTDLLVRDALRSGSKSSFHSCTHQLRISKSVVASPGKSWTCFVLIQSQSTMG